MRGSAVVALALVAGVLGTPLISTRAADRKTELGDLGDGKTTTPTQYDPNNAANLMLDKRALPGGVYFCTDNYFAGSCRHLTGFNAGQCVKIPDDFNDKISSFGPDQGLSCMLWSDWDCKGRSLGYFTNPGSNNLANENFNDITSSFVCKAA